MTRDPFKPVKFKRLDWKNVVLALLACMGFALLGCNTLIDHFTPTAYDPLVGDFLELKDEDVPQFMGFTSLYLANHMKIWANIKHRDDNLKLLRKAEDNHLAHSDVIGYLRAAIDEAEEFQNIIVGSENNPFSVAGLLACAVPGLMAGRAMKRKNDYSPEEAKKLAKEVEKRTEARVQAAAATS